MKFKDSAAVEELTWELRLADYERARNRARINDLFNGAPPFTDDEVAKNNIETNVNFLEPSKIAHDARRQFYNAFLSPDPLFTVGIDRGPRHKRQEWSSRITQGINRKMKRSLPYLEARRSTFASTVLHGIGPCLWEDREDWCPDALGIEDVLLPGSTLLSMKNLPFIAFYRKYTALQLHRFISGPKVDKAWNVPMAKRLIKWADEEATRMIGNIWPEVWSPDKTAERLKENGGIFVSDQVPTINCWDFYFYNDDTKRAGWNRRIVLDTYDSNNADSAALAPNKQRYGSTKSEFLYNPEDRVYADSLGQIAHFQFADASCVAPFRYHSVRSLGFLLYSICHLQNRMHCKFNDAALEALLQYFRVASPDDMERLQDIKLTDKGVLPEGLNFVPPNERWAVNETLVMNVLQTNRQSMIDSASGFTQDLDLRGADQSRETATRTMAKVNQTASLVSSMLNQAYNYQAFQYDEICRRFRRPNSNNADVRAFRRDMLKEGVPSDVITEDCWDVRPVRVIGAGNKTLQIAIADKLVAMRQFLTPSSQKEVDKIYISANTDDWDLADRLVPDQPEISNSVLQAQYAIGTLLQGLPVAVAHNVNHVEYIEAAMASFATKVQEIGQRGGVPTPAEMPGLEAAGQHIAGHIAALAADRNEQPRVRQYGDDLGQLMNEVKAFRQRLEEEMKAQAEKNQQDPELMAKLQAEMALTKMKLESMQTEMKLRLAESQAEQQRLATEHALNLKAAMQQSQVELQAKQAEAAQSLEQSQREHDLKMTEKREMSALNIATKRAESAAKVEAAKKEAAAKPKPTTNEEA